MIHTGCYWNQWGVIVKLDIQEKNFSEVSINMKKLFVNKIHFKMLSCKWCPCWSYLNVLTVEVLQDSQGFTSYLALVKYIRNCVMPMQKMKKTVILLWALYLVMATLGTVRSADMRMTKLWSHVVYMWPAYQRLIVYSVITYISGQFYWADDISPNGCQDNMWFDSPLRVIT